MTYLFCCVLFKTEVYWNMIDMKYIAIVCLLIVSGLFYTPTVHAAKPFTAKKTAPVKASAGTKSPIPAVVKFRSDRRAILFSFSSFSGIESVNYSFTYTNNGKPEGAGGTIRAANNPTTVRELVFGTCSTSVCSYHTNIKNARLVVTAKFSNGTQGTRAFRLKV